MGGDKLDNRGSGDARQAWPAIQRDGRKAAAIAGAGGGVLYLLGWTLLPALLIGAAVIMVFVSRDPERVVPQGRQIILAPADGRISRIEEVPVPPELGALLSGTGSPSALVVRVTIAMSVFGVQVCRSPVAGTIESALLIPARTPAATLGLAGEAGEAQHLAVRMADGVAVGVSLFAGTPGQWMNAFVKSGDMLAAGQRIAIMRLGREVELYLPQGTGSQVVLGQRVVAGETRIAEVGATVFIEGLRH
ncbi:phosphatidylserine decarboxylase family protein [Erythrobacteraceae bacterium CFH 75059]|uniref:phosphatidylserine decarboxylase n=1 Tax=Qipengyuania thermophila TaxID=2509361 RepID=UPI001021215A|nr:phosphatidylserine decarboxylase [Qipengyuania thermophila]TCD05012.1 phosphatidylserine decarboxylase family protein [Erythrobacteraceae bacterium CFH 75059]